MLSGYLLSVHFGLPDTWGIDVIRLERTDDLYRAFIGTPSITSNNLVDLYSVKYMILVALIEKDLRFELIYSRLEDLHGKREDLLKENTVLRGFTMDIEKANTLTLSILEEAPAYHQWIFDKVKPWLGKNILEVGCGIGNLTGPLLQAGKVVASDINPRHLQRVHEKFGNHSNLSGVLLWDIQQDLSKNLPMSIDTILCSNVLEHVEDDDAVLSRFFRFLPEGGRLVLLVPALRILYNPLDRELGHFRRYTKRKLIPKLERNHFHICSLKYFNFFGIFGWFVNGTLLRRSILPAEQVRMFNQLVPLMVQIERWVPPVIGQSFIAIGEKDWRKNWT